MPRFIYSKCYFIYRKTSVAAMTALVSILFSTVSLSSFHPLPPSYPFTCAILNPAQNSVYHGPIYAGVDTTVEIPRDQELYIYYERRRAEASWIDVCGVDAVGSNGFSYSKGGTIQGGPYFQQQMGPQPRESFHMRVISNRLEGYSHHAWDGVSRERTSYGYAFGWFDSAGYTEPNTVLHFCIQANQSGSCARIFGSKSKKRARRLQNSQN